MVKPMVIDDNTIKTIEASEFKAKCLQLIDRVAESGRPLVIIKNGRPVAQLGPVVTRPATLAGAHRGQITVVDDLLSPIDEEWEAAR